MSKQTAVNQIFAQIKAGRKDTKFWNDSMLVDWLLESEERFKQMEKEQHEETWFSSRVEDMGDEFRVEQKSFEDYYNETYGGDTGIIGVANISWTNTNKLNNGGQDVPMISKQCEQYYNETYGGNNE